MTRKLLAEFLGTLLLVFFGCGAIVIDQVSHGAITHMGVAVSFGLIVSIVIYSLSSVSGAHINPAVSAAFALHGHLPWRECALYIVVQILGALSASFLLHLMFPLSADLGATLPSGSYQQSFILEFIMSFVLMLVIVRLGAQESNIRSLAGLIIGGTVFLEAAVGGPISGASMNPARSIGPALVSGNVHSLELYIISPTLACLCAVLCERTLFHRAS